MIEGSTTHSKSGPMRIVRTAYTVENAKHGIVTLTKTVSTLGARTLTSWSFKRPCDTCAIASFKTPEAILSGPYLN